MKKIILIIGIFLNTPIFSQQKDTVKCFLLVSDTSASSADHAVWWIQAYDVREKHNTAEGQMDPMFCPNCWQDYWKHLYYVDRFERKLLPSKYCVWICK